jgi:hypothetical protein
VSVVAAACAAFVLACQPGQTPLAHGTLLAFRPTIDGPLRVIDLRAGATRWRLPPGLLAGHLLIHRDGSLLTWFDADTGARVADAVLQAYGTFALVGASQDGRQAVLARTERRSTTFAVVSRSGERDTSHPGHWRFEALDGRRLTVVRSLPGRPLQQVDQGRFVLTLYHSSVQVLDAALGASRFVALRDGPATTLLPDPDGRTVWAVAGGRITAIDAATARIVSSFSFVPGRWNATTPVAALAPDGEHIALTDAQHIVVVTLATHAVQHVRPHVAIALGWSPDQSRLWVLGERSRVSPLRLRLLH